MMVGENGESAGEFSTVAQKWRVGDWLAGWVCYWRVGGVVGLQRSTQWDEME